MGSSRCPRSTRIASWMALGRPRSMMASSAARTQPDEGQVGGPAVLLDDLVGDADQRPLQGRFVEHLGLFPGLHGQKKDPLSGVGRDARDAFKLFMSSPCEPRRVHLKELSA